MKLNCFSRTCSLALLLFTNLSYAENNVDQITLGKKIYLENCTACHGKDGDGKGPAAVAISGAKPRNFTEGQFKYGSTDKEIYNTITIGVPKTAMPGWNSLSEKDRWALVAYLKSLKK